MQRILDSRRQSGDDVGVFCSATAESSDVARNVGCALLVGVLGLGLLGVGGLGPVGELGRACFLALCESLRGSSPLCEIGRLRDLRLSPLGCLCSPLERGHAASGWQSRHGCSLLQGEEGEAESDEELGEHVGRFRGLSAGERVLPEELLRRV